MPLQLGAPPVSEQLHPLAQFALQSQQNRHELQMRVGLQLAQLKQRDLQFQAQEGRLKEVFDKQHLLRQRMLEAQVDRDAASRVNEQFLRQKALHSMGQEYIPNPDYRSEVEEFERTGLRRMREGGFSEDSDEFLRFQQELADRKARTPAMTLRPREGMVPPGQTEENPGTVETAIKAGGVWAERFKGYKKEHYGAPLIWAQRGNTPKYLIADPDWIERVDKEIAAQVEHKNKLAQIQAQKSGEQSWEKRMEDQAVWVKDFAKDMVRNDPGMSPEDAVEKAKALYEKIMVNPETARENAAATLKDIDDKRTQFQMRLAELGDLTPQQAEEARDILKAFDTYEQMINRLGPYNSKTWPLAERTLYSRVMKTLQPLFSGTPQAKTTGTRSIGGPPTQADIAEAQLTGQGMESPGQTSPQEESGLLRTPGATSPINPTAMSAGMQGEVANPIPGFVEILSAIRSVLPRSTKGEKEDPNLRRLLQNRPF